MSAEINYSNGDKYIGDVRDGLPHGYGTYYKKSSGEKNIGDFRYGKLNGVATMYLKDGNIATCGWINSKPQNCVYSLKTGGKMLIKFKNNKPVSKEYIDIHYTYHDLFPRNKEEKKIEEVNNYSQKGDKNSTNKENIFPDQTKPKKYESQIKQAQSQKINEWCPYHKNNKEYSMCLMCKLEFFKTQGEYDKCLNDVIAERKATTEKFKSEEKRRKIEKIEKARKAKEIVKKNIAMCNSSKNVNLLSSVFWENLATQLQVSTLNPQYKVVDVKWVEFGKFFFIPLGGSCMVKIYTNKGSCNAPVKVISKNGKKYFHSQSAEPCMPSF